MGSSLSEYWKKCWILLCKNPKPSARPYSLLSASLGPTRVRPLNCSAAVELQLQRQLDVVGVRAIHVVFEGVVEDREDALVRDVVGRVGQHGAQHDGEVKFNFLKHRSP